MFFNFRSNFSIICNSIHITVKGSIPRLVKYVKKCNLSFWSIVLDKYIYVFYVAEGTISRDISLA